MREPEFEQIHDLVALLTATTSGADYRRARKRLEKEEREKTVPALIRALERAHDSRAFDRTARILAAFGGEAAFESLAAHARANRRFPRLALRALAECRHSQVVPLLLDLLEHGRIKQRRAAARHLAGLGAARAIEPLCRAAAQGESEIGPEARAALYLMGRPEHLARKLLAEPSLSAVDRVRVIALLTLAGRPGLFRAPFYPQRFLEREAENRRSPVREAARRRRPAARTAHAASPLRTPRRRHAAARGAWPWHGR